MTAVQPKTTRRCILFAALAGCLTFGLASSAMAQPKPNVFDGGNRWLITAFDDSSPVHQQWATQGICFLPYATWGTQVRGIWYSDTFYNWRGRYAQEGDRVLMHGDYANDVGHDGMVIELSFGTTPNDVGAGQWTEWREYGANGLTIGFVNSRLRRVGRCPLPINISTMTIDEQAKYVAEIALKVPPRYTTTGAMAEYPLDPNQIPLKDE